MSATADRDERLESAPGKDPGVLGERKITNTVALIIGIGGVALGLVSLAFLVSWVIMYLRAG